MPFRYQSVKRYKRGARWPDGETRTCTRCRIEKNGGQRGRAKAAVVTAEVRKTGSKYVIPVAYCEAHIPEDLA